MQRIRRRDFLKALGAGAAAVALPRALRGADGGPRRRPNIIVILSDDMGYSDLGCYGGEIRTPNLDALASRGLRFTQFYNTARCCPTRASLLTGLYPHQAAIGHMTDDKGLEGYQGDLSHKAVTIAEALKPAGYAAYMVGKWHVTRYDTDKGPMDNWPLARGFDRFYGTIRGAGDYFDPGTLTRDNTMISPFADPEYKPERFYYTDAIADHAARFISEHVKQKPDRPFFLYAAFTAAHWPMHAPEEDIARYKGKYDGGYEPVRARRFQRLKELGLVRPQWGLSPQEGDWSKVENKEWEARCMEVYAAMIDRLDQGIGRIAAELEKQGQLQDTLLLFLQDNGACQEDIGRSGRMTRPEKPTLPEIPLDAVRLDVRPKQNRRGVPTLQGPGVMPGPEDTYISYGIGWANCSNTPFRYYKHFVHEGGISTPLIAHWPAGIARRGELEHQPGHLIDIMATCVDLAGATYPADFKGEKIAPPEGRSLAPAFEGKPIRREGLYWEHEGNRAVRVGKWKLVAKGAKGPWELYDMEADRTELADLAAAQPDRVKEMAALWMAWAERAKAVPWPWDAKAAKTGALSKEKRFELKQGDSLPRERAPNIAGKSFEIAATIQAAAGDGVIVAQGGSTHGYSLYLQDGRLIMITRHKGKLTVVAAPDKLPAGPAQVTARLAKDGAITLEIGGKQVAAGKAPGPIPEMPADGLQVGADEGGAVGDYAAPNEFRGKIEKVVITLGE
jgi:arylsulfatase A-like enzyme